MVIWARIWGLSFGQFLVLIKLFIKKPAYLLPTIKATSETLKICNRKFGNRHGGHSRENAFRHALWNFLICYRIYQVTDSEEKAAAWARQFTDLHEKLVPNKEAARKMDLHNKLIGRKLFLNDRMGIESIIPIFGEMMKKAINISESSEMENAKDQMVYIDN